MCICENSNSTQKKIDYCDVNFIPLITFIIFPWQHVRELLLDVCHCCCKLLIKSKNCDNDWISYETPSHFYEKKNIFLPFLFVRYAMLLWGLLWFFFFYYRSCSYVSYFDTCLFTYSILLLNSFILPFNLLLSHTCMWHKREEAYID